ncbi:hypothetical protein ACNQ2B_02835 [Mycoplasma sp. Z707]|uniref:hypothetical protein n=2 Tax=unclassified Mycoplasma TaxID=2683645 RepID=UPI003AB04E1D
MSNLIQIKIKTTAKIKDQIPIKQLRMIEIINKFSGKLSLKDMASKAGVSYKTFREFYKKCSNNNIYVIKQNHKRKYKRQISNEEIREQVILFHRLNKEIFKASDIGEKSITLLHFYNEYLPRKIRDNMSYSLFCKRTIEQGLATPHRSKKSNRKARTNLIKLHKNTSKAEILSSIKMEISITDKVLSSKHFKQCDNNYDLGEVVEIDACVDGWIKDIIDFHLYAAVDRSDGKKLLALWAEKEETNIGYLKLFEQMFEVYGIPIKVLADRRRTFYSSNNTITPVSKTLKERYHIEIETSSSPTFKPNVERLWKTMQHWLSPFLAKNNIKSIDSVNENSKYIINSYNSKYSNIKSEKKIVSLFEEVPLDLQKIFVEIPRKFIAGTVQYKNNFYVPITENNKRYLITSDEASIKFGYDSNNELVFFIDGKYYKSQMLKNNELTEYQHFVIKNYLDIDDEYTKKFYRAVKKSKEFAHNLYEVVAKIKSKYNLSEEIKDYLNISKEILNSLYLIYKEIIEKEHIALK